MLLLASHFVICHKKGNDSMVQRYDFIGGKQYWMNEDRVGWGWVCVEVNLKEWSSGFESKRNNYQLFWWYIQSDRRVLSTQWRRWVWEYKWGIMDNDLSSDFIAKNGYTAISFTILSVDGWSRRVCFFGQSKNTSHGEKSNAIQSCTSAIMRHEHSICATRF